MRLGDDKCSRRMPEFKEGNCAEQVYAQNLVNRSLDSTYEVMVASQDG